MITSFNLKRGLAVKDTVSGLEGMLIAYALKVNNSKQYAIQPKSLGGSDKPDSWFVDVDDVVYDPQVAEIFGGEPPTEVEFKFELLEKVKDTTTGMKGKIVACIHWKNECVKYYVQPKARKGATKLPDSFSSDETELVSINKKKSSTIGNKPSPGGPSIVCRSQKVL